MNWLRRGESSGMTVLLMAAWGAAAPLGAQPVVERAVRDALLGSRGGALQFTAYPQARTGGNYMHNYYLPPAAGTPWRPCFSPDGEWIAFSMAGSIWKIRIGEDVAYQLTANATYDSSPIWSPDGRWIVYTADDRYRSINLMLFDTATGESTALTRNEHVHLDPVWAPDGSRILYVSTDPGGWYNLYAMPLQNGVPGEPMRLTEDNAYANSRLYFGSRDLHIQPTLSPDGKEMILVSNRGIPLGSGALWRAPVAPDAMSRAKQILREETLYRTRPQWSPDGARIVYSSHRGNQYNNLYVLPVEGGEPYQLTFGEWDRFDPRWSPDGEWIVYVSNRRGVTDLRLLKTFGGEERAVEIRRRAYRRPHGTLKVVVTDADTGRPHGSADSSARRGRQGIRPARSVPAGRRARPAPGLLPRKRGVFARLAGRAGLDPGDQGIRAQAYRGRRRGGSRRRCLAPPVSGTLYRLQGSGLVQRQRPRTHELRRQPA